MTRQEPSVCRRMQRCATGRPKCRKDEMERQVLHSFAEPVVVELGRVKQGDNDQRTFFVEMKQTEPLARALRMLYDGTHVGMPALNGAWKWHVTCVRDSRNRDLDALWLAAKELDMACSWPVSQVSYLQLKGHRYEEIASWRV